MPKSSTKKFTSSRKNGRVMGGRKSKRTTRRSTRRVRGGGMLDALNHAPLTPSLPGGLSSVQPVTDWGRWAAYPNATAWSSTTSAPAPLANGGLYTNPQSTAPWASSPFPATQHAFALEAAKVSGLPEVAYHQRPNDNFGTSYSPSVGTPIRPNMWSESGPAGPIPQSGGRRRNKRRQTRRM